MRQIPETGLWIGNALDARSFERLFAARIEAVVDLAMEELPEPPPRSMAWLRIPLLDGAGNSPARLRLAVDSVLSLLCSQEATLVACSGGMSRSPAIAAATLAAFRKESPDEWLVRVVEGGPHDLAPALWWDVKRVLEGRSADEHH
jgi:hypothetical protein